MKKTVFIFLAALLVVLVIELSSFAALSLAKKEGVSRAGFFEDRARIIESGGVFDQFDIMTPFYMKRDILHPYLGFVLDRPTEADPYGFLNTVNPIQKKEEGKVIIAVTGGSVALQLYDATMERILERLKSHPEFRDKKFVTIRLALGGFKQPQQLMTLNYFLSLGGEFDILINLDGFNETALAMSENVPANVAPFFPRKWILRTDLLSDPELFRLAADALKFRRCRVRLAGLFQASFLTRSFALNILWKALDDGLQRMIGEVNRSLKRNFTQAHSYAATGPRLTYANNAAMFQEIADVWQRSSRQMQALCDANGIRYFHFLQPNQYFPESKPLTEEEKKTAFDYWSHYRKPVEDLYPYLRTGGAELKKAGVDFTDLSMTFAGNARTLYVDPCCHVNQEGYATLAEEIAKAILAGHETPQAATV